MRGALDQPWANFSLGRSVLTRTPVGFPQGPTHWSQGQSGGSEAPPIICRTP